MKSSEVRALKKYANNLTERVRKSDLYRIQGDNIAIIGYATEAMYANRGIKDYLVSIIAEAQKSNAFIRRYEPEKALESNSNQIRLFSL